ncbi:MAG: transporter substrate-binding domain-containing protein [Bacteroidetes bacterium]|nr:transporter substrate-binding domain-containing protein [Bacteroidota bacterium]
MPDYGKVVGIFSTAKKLLTILLVTAVPLTVLSQKPNDQLNQSWQEAEKAGQAIVTVFWSDTHPFISVDRNGNMQGVEYEIMMGFKDYLRAAHHVELQFQWKKVKSFNEVYDQIRNKSEINSFGTSGISVTEARQNEVGFSPSYMADIAVLISSQNVPIVENVEEFVRVFRHLTAVTVQKSTLENDLLKLKSAAGNLSFPIKYVRSSQFVLEEIQQTDNGFGFVDLPIYINSFKANPTAKVKRQNLFPKVREGYAIIYPLGSDWQEPFNAYFQDKEFKKKFVKIIAKYVDVDLYNFIESLSVPSSSQISLLLKEKEIQSEHLQQEIHIRNMGVALLGMAFASLLIIIWLFRRSHRLLKKIEQQGANIESQNKELEAKNKKLEEFTFANAHKLRAPVATILGLIQLLGYHNIQDNENIISGLKGAASNLDHEIKEIRSRLEEEGWLPRESSDKV